MVQRFSQRVRFSGLGFSFQRSSSHSQPCNGRVSTVSSLSTEEPDASGRPERLRALCCKFRWPHLTQHTPYSQLPFGLSKSLIYSIACKLEKQKQPAVLHTNQEAQHLAPHHNHTIFKMLGYKYFSCRKQIKVHLHFRFRAPLFLHPCKRKGDITPETCQQPSS